MKPASPELIARFASKAFDATVLLDIFRKDGDTRAFTSYNRTLKVDDIDYIPGYTRTAITSSDALNVNRFEITGFIDDRFLGAQDLRAGKYDDATCRVTLVDPKHLEWGGMVCTGAVFGEVRMESPTKYTVEISTKSNRYAQQTGELYGPNCPAQYGDDRCKLTRLSFTGRVTSIVTDRRKFTAVATGDPFPPNDLLPVPTWQNKKEYYINQSVSPSAPTGFRYEAQTSGKSDGNEPTWPTNEFDVVADNEVLWMALKDDYFKKGRILWTLGDNTGFGGEIFSYDGADTFQIFLQTFYAIAEDDEFTVEAGDDKKWATCKYKFDNVVNFRGFMWSRGERKLVEAPDSTKIKGN